MSIGPVDPFHDLHPGLTVRLIATPKASFFVCRGHELVSDVMRRNAEKFDFVPVVGDSVEGNEAVVGVIDLSPFFDVKSPDVAVAELLIRLNEKHLIGADASILAFARSADRRPFRLVVSDEGIVGLVSLSDIQALPVRVALFALVTGLEMTMSEAISRRYPTQSEWRRFLNGTRREKLDETLSRARDTEGIVSELLFTQFADKVEIIRKGVLADRPDRAVIARKLRAVQSLRDHLAHANDYAANRRQAAMVSQNVRDMLAVRALLIDLT